MIMASFFVMVAAWLAQPAPSSSLDYEVFKT